MRREFTANVTHELKTPLTSISGYAEIIASGLVKPDDIPNFANKIHKESGRLLSLISDIMELSQLDEKFSDENLSLLTLQGLRPRLLRISVQMPKSTELQSLLIQKLPS